MDAVNFEALVLSLCRLECNAAADFFVVGCRVMDRCSTSGRCHGGRKAGRSARSLACCVAGMFSFVTWTSTCVLTGFYVQHEATSLGAWLYAFATDSASSSCVH